jgi:hypothetical protein
LRDLTATKLLDSGDSALPRTLAGIVAILEATVTSNDGKRVEKVSIWKQADKYYAKREGEPTVYELDAKAVEDVQKAAGEVKEFQPPKSGKK